MKKTLRLLAVVLALVLVLGALSACGGGDTQPSTAPDPTPAATPEPTPEPTPEAPAAEPVDRADYNIPSQYTKVKIYDGSYGFGDAEIISAMNDDESAFYIQFVCFDEDQALEGTVSNGICMVTFDLSGFVSGDAQLIYDDTLANENPWQPLTGEAAPAAEPVARADYSIPEQYTKVKIYDGSYGFGDAEIISAMNDDESAFYIQFVCFDEDQALEGTVSNGICLVTYDLSGFVSGDAQLIYDDTLANENPWQPLQ